MVLKNKKITLGGQEISYSLRSYKSSRHLRLAVSSNGAVTVTKPIFVTEKMAHDFLEAKGAWILAQLAKNANNPQRLSPAQEIAEYQRYKIRAHNFVSDRLEYFNQFYGFKYGRVSVRRQKTRWGSCSRAGNLNFNYRLIFLEPAAADYIIVHELCHLGEFNHSPDFWRLVAQQIPDYRQLRKQVKFFKD
ncbi:MAG: M48 family metallopeptidase [Candidatus Falkowbacteria bacterium]|nr:MAG: M48 family metallopeptidase [Candidatus Falkowbacteria bacterium]